MSRSRRARKAQPAKPKSRSPKPEAAPLVTGSGRTGLLVPLGVFLVLLTIYLRTLLRTMVDQDSGELVAAAHTLGIAHPTGYPLWLLLGRAFDCLPVGGTSAFRVGLASAVPGAAAGALVSLLALRLTAQPLPAGAAGLAFGLWYPCWSQSVRAEVYAVGALLFTLSLFGLRRWDRQRTARALLWFSLACGLVSVHHRTVFLAVSVAFLAAFALTPPRCRARWLALAWLLAMAVAVSKISHAGMAALGIGFALLVGIALAWRKCLRPYLASVALFVAPCSLYLVLWVRALQQPALNWTNPTTLDRLLYHALAKQYFYLAFAHSLDQMVEQGVKLLPQLLAPTAPGSALLAAIGLPLITWGWIVWWRKERVAAGSLAAGCVLLCVWVLQWGETSDLKVFLAPLGATFAVCGAMGLAQLGARLRREQIARGAVLAVAAAICAIQLGTNWGRADLSNSWEHRDRWYAALAQMAPNAVFVSDFDVPSFATLYLQNVEGFRRDVTLIRTVRLPTPEQPETWYLDLIEDAELRKAAREEWPRARAGAEEVHDQTALFAHLLKKRLPARSIYSVHGPMQVQVAAPPHFVGLSEDVVRLDLRRPEMARPLREGGPIAEFPGPDLSLMRFATDRAAAGNGELVRFTAAWRLAGALPRAQFAVALLPAGMDYERVIKVTESSERLVQAFPVAYGLWGLGPSPGGTVYEQQGEIIIPTNAAPGVYRLAVAVAPLYTMAYQGWAEVGEMRVTARPRPRNGP